MKTSLVNFAVFILAAMAICHATTKGSNANAWKSYRVDLPSFVIEFSVPAELKEGYGSFRKEVVFENPPNRQFTSSFGEGAHSKNVGTLFLGVKGDFRDWDILTGILVIKFDPIRHPMHSAKDLAEFVREMMSKKYVLANGDEVDDLGTLTIEKIGHHDVVVATRADPNRIRTVKIKDMEGKYTEEKLTQNPYQFYYIRLDDETTVGIRVSHDNENKLGPKWYAESHARIAKIIESLKVQPKKM